MLVTAAAAPACTCAYSGGGCRRGHAGAQSGGVVMIGNHVEELAAGILGQSPGPAGDHQPTHDSHDRDRDPLTCIRQALRHAAATPKTEWQGDFARDRRVEMSKGTPTHAQTPPVACGARD